MAKFVDLLVIGMSFVFGAFCILYAVGLLYVLFRIAWKALKG